MASNAPSDDNPYGIRLKKFSVNISISEAAARRLEQELPALQESWLEMKRDLLQWEADRLHALLYERKAP